MIDEQINEAIAAAINGKRDTEYGALYSSSYGWTCNCPDFCNDLNAMHEALKTLPSDQLWDVAYSLPMETMLGFMATAKELAETFLLVHKKYTATTEDSSAVGQEVQP